MAHVVVVTQDADVRIVLDVYLHVKGHVVMSVAEARHALPALQLGRYPAVVIIHAPSNADDGLDLLRWAASDSSGRLARHSYLLLTGDTTTMTAATAARVAQLSAQVMELPFDLDEVGMTVDDAECALLARELHARRPRVVPFRQSAEG